MAASKQIYRYKGRIVSKEKYEKITRGVKLGEKNRGKRVSLDNNNTEAPEDDGDDDSEGDERIVSLKFLGKQLWCLSCKEPISLNNVESEQRQGFGSVLNIRCHKCLLIREVTTSKQRQSSSDKRTYRFEINFKAVLGVMHSGMTYTQLRKLCTMINVPCPTRKIYKKYEDEVGEAAKKVAKDSCNEAVAKEREMTVASAAEIAKFLPEEYQSNFILPDKNSQVSFDDVVRLVISYDCAWTTRGAGRSYDSLNGFGAAIGYFSGLVLDYDTCNRTCKKCEMGRDRSDHKCHKNFYGSAKAMEPHIAKKICVESEILKRNNVEVGVFIGDDNSSAVAACRAVASHDIIKQSDVNHTSGGVKKALFSIQKSHSEMTRDVIIYLHRCFSYGVCQNKGNSKKIAEAILSIPYHVFNDHSKCGSWCGFVKDKENYDHLIIPGGLKSPKLFESLVDIFTKLSVNAEKFSAGASSNVNESLNAMMSAKHSKRLCLSKTGSADYRFSCVISQKNLGEGYTEKILNTLKLSSGKRLRDFVIKTDKLLKKKRVMMRSKEFKRQRALIKKQRAGLRHRKEHDEGTTYKSNCSLLSEPTAKANAFNNGTPDDRPINDDDDNEKNNKDDNNKTNNNDEGSNDDDDDDDGGGGNSEINNEDGTPIVFVDLETSGLGFASEILQIASLSGSLAFDTYVTATRPIPITATAVNGITSSYGTMMYNGKIVQSVSMKIALTNFLFWLQSFDKKCCIAVHNLSFDGPRLMALFEKYSMLKNFQDVILGFVDTLEVIRKDENEKIKKSNGVIKKRESNALSILATTLAISIDGAHNAIWDCKILQEVLKRLQITNGIILQRMKLFEERRCHWNLLFEAKENVRTFSDLTTVSLSIKNKLAQRGFTMNTLREKFNAEGEHGLRIMLDVRDSSTRLRKKTIDKIISFFQ